MQLYNGRSNKDGQPSNYTEFMDAIVVFDFKDYPKRKLLSDRAPKTSHREQGQKDT
jgi:hypothetical protein